MSAKSYSEKLKNLWRCAGPRQRAAMAAGLLTAAIAGLFALVYASLPLTGTRFVFEDDSFYQHYPFLIAIGRWLRAFLAHPGQTPMFSGFLGLGADWIGALNYYGVGDPLTLLAALFDGASMYRCYVLLILLRHVLAGLAFLAMARGFGVRWKHALTAAAAYAFTHYMVAWGGLIHPMFANPAIHLPLMVLGCEKRFRGEAPWVLMLSTAWSALCGFYFFYMNSVMLLLFALVRRGCAYRGRLPLGRAFLWAAVPYGLGVGLALPVLLPALLGYLDSARTAAAAQRTWLPAAETVWEFPTGFIASNGWNNAATVPVAAAMAVCTLFRRRGERALKVSVALASLALLVPAFGSLMNGFSYASDRWKYGLVLLWMFVFAREMGAVERGRAGGRLCLGLALWSLVLMGRNLWLRQTDVHGLLPVLALLLAAAGGIEVRLARRRARQGKGGTVLLAVFLAGNLLVNGLVLCASHILTDGIRQDPWTLRSATSLAAAGTPASRVELTDAEYGSFNAPAVTGTPSTSVYMSMQPSVTVDFLRALEVGTLVNPNRMHGLDQRAALEALWSVELLTAPADAAFSVPYGFEKVSEAEGVQVWRNALALPTAWTAAARMSPSDWAALSAVDRQWALLQCAVAEDVSVPEGTPELTARTVSWRLGAQRNASMEGNTLFFGEGGGTVELEFDGLPDSECYLVLRGVTADFASEHLRIRTACGDGRGLLLIPSDDYAYSLRRRDFTVHLGWQADAPDRVILWADQAAAVSAEAISVVCQPMGAFESLIEARRQGILSASPLGDVLRAEVDLPEDRLVCFSVPAVRGWRAEVDGQPTALRKNAGALWMVEVPAGVHTVTLRYRTPGLAAGAVSALLCGAAAAGWGLVRRRKEVRRRERQ